MRRLRERRSWLVVATLCAVAFGVFPFYVSYLRGWRFGLSSGDTTAVVTAVLTFDTCWFAVVAALIAIVAYLAASGTPDLHISVTCNPDKSHRLVLEAQDEPDPHGHHTLKPSTQARAAVMLHNRSKYAARNPGVRIEILLLWDVREPQAGWQTLNYRTAKGEIPVFQWEGGVDNIVHGLWSRTLPDLDLGGATALLGQYATLVVTVVADGVRPKSTTFPVQVLGAVAFETYDRQREERLTREADAELAEYARRARRHGPWRRPRRGARQPLSRLRAPEPPMPQDESINVSALQWWR